jgi:hypothetical protein
LRRVLLWIENFMCNSSGVWFNEIVIVCVLRSVARRWLVKTGNPSACATVICKWCKWVTALYCLCVSVINPSAWRFKFRCCVSLAVLFSARHLNSDRELLYSSLFLNYMRYKHETFTKMILKDGFISFLFNIGALYLSNGSGWIDRLPCTGRKTPEPCFCTSPCTSKSLNSPNVNAMRIRNMLQKTACL